MRSPYLFADHLLIGRSGQILANRALVDFLTQTLLEGTLGAIHRERLEFVEGYSLADEKAHHMVKHAILEPLLQH